MILKKYLKTEPTTNLFFVAALFTLSVLVGGTLFARQDTTPIEGSAVVCPNYESCNEDEVFVVTGRDGSCLRAECLPRGEVTTCDVPGCNEGQTAVCEITTPGQCSGCNCKPSLCPTPPSCRPGQTVLEKDYLFICTEFECVGEAHTSTPTPSPSLTPTPTSTPIPTSSPKPTKTPTPSPTKRTTQHTTQKPPEPTPTSEEAAVTGTPTPSPTICPVALCDPGYDLLCKIAYDQCPECTCTKTDSETPGEDVVEPTYVTPTPTPTLSPLPTLEYESIAPSEGEVPEETVVALLALVLVGLFVTGSLYTIYKRRREDKRKRAFG
ncbi:MAG: hypothetical protein ACE5DX_02390 [Candidatus Dojkabacteria bacterium]